MRLIVLSVLALASGGLFQTTQGASATMWPPKDVFTYRDGIVLPVVVSTVDPVYPQATPTQRQGFVALEFVVEADGSVGPVRIVTSLSEQLDEAAERTLKQWRFRPGTKDGAPVRALCHTVLIFTIPGAPAPMTLPAGFDDGPQATTTKWTREVIESNGLQIAFAYPDGYRRASPELAAIGAVSAASLSSITVTRPSPLAGDPPFPLSILDLGRYAEGLRNQLAPTDKDLWTVGAGQATFGNMNWLWVEFNGSTMPGLAEATSGQLEGAHVWAFSTAVKSRLVQVICVAAILKKDRPDVRDSSFGQARTDCSESLKRISLTAK